MKFMLRSPMHSLVSKSVLLISFTGRKSGKPYTTPVSYSQSGDQVIIFTHAEWWKNLRSDTPVTLFVSCVGGIARSGAIALFAAELFGVDTDKFIAENDHILPNLHVHTLLHQLAEARGDSMPKANKVDMELITKAWDDRHQEIF